MKKRIFCTVAALLIYFAGIAAAAEDVTLTVKVEDGYGESVRGARVVLADFEDLANSYIDYTAENGETSFTVPNDGKQYAIIPSSHGWTPTFLDWVNSADYEPVEWAASTAEETVTVGLQKMTDLSGICKVKSEVTVDTTTVIFGGIGHDSRTGDVAMGAGFAPDADTDSIYYYNVPNHLGDDGYGAGCFSPVMNTHIDGTISGITSSETGTVAGPTLDLTSTEAESPDTTESSAGTADLLIFRGVVTSPGGEALPDAEVKIEYGTTTADGNLVWDSFTSWTDSNGIYRVYGDTVPPSATFHYYVSRKGSVGVSTAVPVNFQETTLPARKNFTLDVADGKLKGVLLLDGTPVPDGHVHVHGDWTAWSIDGSTTNLVKEEPFIWADSRIRSDGTFDIGGLPRGNYILEIWSDFSQDEIIYNNGPNGREDIVDWSYRRVGSDDLRIKVWSSTFSVFTSTGGDVTVQETNEDGRLKVNIPPKDFTESSTATITGFVKLLSGDEIVDESPVTLIVSENNYEHEFSTYGVNSGTATEEEDLVYVDLPHSRVSEDSVELLSHEDFAWVDWEHPETGKSRIYWYATQAPEKGETVELNYDYQNPDMPVRLFETVSGTGTDFPFEITVEAGKKYRMNIRSLYYGESLKMGQWDQLDNIDFTGDRTTFDIGELAVAPAGQVRGYVRKPDGNYFRPVYKLIEDDANDYKVELGMEVVADGITVDSWDDAEVHDDGSFLLTGLLPGEYHLKTRTGLWVEPKEKLNEELGKVPWADTRREITVRASTEPARINLNLERGINIKPEGISVDLTPGATHYFSKEEECWETGDVRREGMIGFFALKKDTQLTPKTLKSFFMGGSEFFDIGFGYNPDSDEFFAGETFEKRVAPGEFDFYGGAIREYDPETDQDDMNMLFLSRRRGVTVSEDLAEYIEQEGPVQEINIPDLELGSVELTGHIAGDHIITKEDLPAIKANPNAVIELLPSVMLYDDTDGRLAGFSALVPKPSEDFGEEFQAIIDQIGEDDAQALEDFNVLLSSDNASYRFRFLRPDTYNAVFYSPNYPAVSAKVDLTADDQKTLNIDFDYGAAEGEEKREVRTASIYATFVDTNTLPISGVKVTAKGPNFDQNYLSDTEGNIEINRLPLGLYYFFINADGYERKATKVRVDKTGVHENEVVLKKAPEIFWGEVLSRRLPSKVAYEGADIVAYHYLDDSGARVTDELVGIYSDTSDSEGNYLINNLLTDHTYRMWLVVPGHLKYSADFKADGTFSGANFLLRNLEPNFSVNYRLDGSSFVFTINANKTMNGAPLVRYTKGNFSSAGSAEWTDVNLNTVTSSRRWRATIDGSDFDPENLYTLRVTGEDTNGVTVENYSSKFAKKYPTRNIKLLEDLLAEGGTVEVDDTGDDVSVVEVPAGAIEIDESSAEATVSAFSSSGEETEIKAMALGGFASLLFSKESLVSQVSNLISEVYTVELEAEDSVAITKPLKIKLEFNRSDFSDAGNNSDNINIRRKNSAGEWEVVEGIISVDETNGTAAIEVSDLNSASFASDMTYSAQSGSQGGEYAVFYGIPEEQTGPQEYIEEKFRAYNFPNPFNLKQKQVTLENYGTSFTGAQQTVEGTVLKYYLPSKYGTDADVEFNIYNVAGELVRTINEPSREGGYIYFTEWNGRNDSNNKCASGVYLAIPRVDGAAVMSDALKMAIIR